MKEVFNFGGEIGYNLRLPNIFRRPLVNSSVCRSTERFSFLGPKIWEMLLENMKKSESRNVWFLAWFLSKHKSLTNLWNGPANIFNICVYLVINPHNFVSTHLTSTYLEQKWPSRASIIFLRDVLGICQLGNWL